VVAAAAGGGEGASVSSDERISSRDALELRACFQACAADLFGYACALTRGDRALADDLVQAAFEAAARAWPALRCRDTEQRRSWLCRTLANIAVSGFRREAAFRNRLPRIEARYRPVETDVLEQVFSADLLERCWRIIQDMPQQQHTVALLRWQLDMKEAEIAAVLRVTEKTVSTHLYRARRKLIAQLGPDSPFARDAPEADPP
jgi:RNA polymerase sigma factor (sigma-70 family)